MGLVELLLEWNREHTTLSAEWRSFYVISHICVTTAFLCYPGLLAVFSLCRTFGRKGRPYFLIFLDWTWTSLAASSLVYRHSIWCIRERIAYGGIDRKDGEEAIQGDDIGGYTSIYNEKHG